MKITAIADYYRDVVWRPCPVCGSDDLEGDNMQIVAKVDCNECGYRGSRWRMISGIGWDEESDNNRSGSSEDTQNVVETESSERSEMNGIQRFAYWTVIWPLRTFYYPVMRFLGKVTGRQKFSNRLIEVTEENIERTMETLEGDD